LYRNINLSCLF